MSATTGPGWPAPLPSTRDAAALASYRAGIAALVADAPSARALLAEAVTIDPEFFLGRVGVAVGEAVAGRSYVPVTATTRLTRGERQHAEVVAAAFGGDPRHAADLRREHLLDYPGDVLIVWLPAVLRRLP
jgi:hypothetical protein